MSIKLKSPEEIEKMRVAGRLASEVLDLVTEHVVPGVTTDELNTICHEHIVNVQGGTPATLNYKGFPKSICTSINQQICHGIPADRVLKKTDILNIDVTVIKDGYFGDTSRMYYVGQPQPHAQRLCEVAYQSMVKGYCGHGNGESLHEEPQVLHVGKPGKGLVLEPGMTFTIEPMINQGKRHTRVLADGWTVVTKDRSLSAQWEHTVLVTEDGYDLLTLGENQSL